MRIKPFGNFEEKSFISDTKCDLLVFNKTKDSSAVKQKMHELMQARAEHKRTVSHNSEGDPRYIFVK